MTTDTRYIAGLSLQEYLVNTASGLPLANGTITSYKDNSRTVLKPLYEQTGSPPSYTFTALPNPLTLGAAGTIVDGSGNDVLPFYYPYDADDDIELYYIVIKDSSGNVIATRQGFPSGVSEITPSTDTIGDTNLVTNGVFYFNNGPFSSFTSLDTVIAPGAHIELLSPDIRFRKNNLNAADSISFQPVTGFSPIQVMPPFYLRYSCSNIPIGETFKRIEIPIAARVYNLQNKQVTISIFGESPLLNTLDVFIIQNFGVGGSPSATVDLLLDTIQLEATSSSYSVAFTVPSISGKTIGTCGGDYVAIAFGFELNSINTTHITCGQMILGNLPLQPYIYETPDQISSKVFGPRTGNVKISMIPDTVPGWLLMDNRTIGSASSGATSRGNVDTFPLYKMIWENVSNIYAPVYTSAGVPTTRGASAVVDFSANKRMSLTNALGRVLSGANPDTLPLVSFPGTVSGAGVTITVPDATQFFLGTELIVNTVSYASLPSPLTNAEIVYVIPISSTTISLATSKANALAGTAISFTTTGTAQLSSHGIHTTVMGQYFGEETHVPNIPELATHHHVSSNPASGGGAFIASGTDITLVASTTGSTGDGNNFNMIQPTLYTNIYIKL